jgi:phage terminase small subunit
MARLSEKQERFCVEYLIDFHVTNAAIRAGYPAKSAHVSGSKLLKNGKIMARIAELRAAASAKTGVSLERNLDQLGAMAFADPADMFHPETGELLPIQQIPAHLRRAIQSIEVDEINVGGQVLGLTKKIKLADRNKAADMIMRHLGEYKKDNAQKQAQVTVVVDIVDDDEDQAQPEPDEIADDELDRLDQEGDIPDEFDEDDDV